LRSYGGLFPIIGKIEKEGGVLRDIIKAIVAFVFFPFVVAGKIDSIRKINFTYP